MLSSSYPPRKKLALIKFATAADYCYWHRYVMMMMMMRMMMMMMMIIMMMRMMLMMMMVMRRVMVVMKRERHANDMDEPDETNEADETVACKSTTEMNAMERPVRWT